LTRFRREHVGFVFQFYNLISSLTALENVALVTEIAETWFCPKHGDQQTGGLKGSEKRRPHAGREIETYDS
jgi:putative ABC transport system ATP-binding protein